jgi:hypothetical protein
VKFSGTPHAPKKRRPGDRFSRKGVLPCDGCNKNCIHSDYYMVHDSVWCVEAKLPKDNCMLCLDCLEIRIGRELVWTDFTGAPVNIEVIERYRFLDGPVP